MGLRRDGFQAGDDRNSNTGGPAFGCKFIKPGIVEKHLSNDIIGSCIYFAFQIFDIDVYIRGFIMFFGISGDTDTKISRYGIFQTFVQVNSPVHIVDLFHQFATVTVAVGFGNEIFLAGDSISA